MILFIISLLILLPHAYSRQCPGGGFLNKEGLCIPCPNNCLSCLNSTFCDTCNFEFYENDGRCIPACSHTHEQEENFCSLKEISNQSSKKIIDLKNEFRIPIGENSFLNQTSKSWILKYADQVFEFKLKFWFKISAEASEDFSMIILTQYPYRIEKVMKYSYILSLNYSKGMLYGPLDFVHTPGIKINMNAWNFINIAYFLNLGSTDFTSFITVCNFLDENPVETQANIFPRTQHINSDYFFLHVGNLFGEEKIGQIKDLQISFDTQREVSGFLQIFLYDFSFHKIISADEYKHMEKNSDGNIISRKYMEIQESLEISLERMQGYVLTINFKYQKIFDQCLSFTINDSDDDIIYSEAISVPKNALQFEGQIGFFLKNRFKINLLNNGKKLIISSENFSIAFKSKNDKVYFKFQGKNYCKSLLTSFIISADPWLDKNVNSDKVWVLRNMCDLVTKSEETCLSKSSCSHDVDKKVFSLESCNDCEELNKDCCIENIPNCQYCSNRNSCSRCKDSYFLYDRVCVESCPSKFKIFQSICHEECPDFTYEVEGICYPCNTYFSSCMFTQENCSYCLKGLFSKGCPLDDNIFLNPNYKCSRCPSNCTKCTKNNSSLVCTECIKDLHIFEGQCVEKCPENFGLEKNECILCNKMNNFIWEGECKIYENLYEGFSSGQLVKYGCNESQYRLDIFCLERNRSDNGCLLMIKDKCYECEDENYFLFKDECYEIFLSNNAMLPPRSTKGFSKNNFEFEGIYFNPPEFCDSILMINGKLKCFNKIFNEKVIFSFQPEKNLLSQCKPENPFCNKDNEEVIQFCTEKRCIGFPKVIFYLHSYDPKLHIINNHTSKKYKISKNVNMHFSKVRVSNFPLCQVDREDLICFYECPQGFIASLNEKECIECSNETCLISKNHISLEQFLAFSKDELIFYTRNKIVEKFSIEFNIAYQLVVSLEFSRLECPKHCAECYKDIDKTLIHCTKCIDPRMIIKSSQCLCPDFDEYFDHETQKCSKNCEKMQIVSNQARECVNSCLYLSSYDLKSYPFSLKNQCLLKCPLNHYVQTEFMYFDKLECKPNTAVDLKTISVDLSELDTFLIKKYGIFQVSLLSPICCPVSNFFEKKSNSEEVMKIMLDLLISKKVELELYRDFHDCLKAYGQKFLREDFLDLQYKIAFWLVQASKLSHKIFDKYFKKELRSINVFLKQNMKEELIDILDGTNFIFSFESEAENSKLESKLNIEIIVISEPMIIICFYAELKDSSLSLSRLKFRHQETKERNFIYLMRNLSSDSDTELANETSINLELNTHYFILMTKKRQSKNYIQILPDQKDFYPNEGLITIYDEGLDKGIVLAISLIFGGLGLIGFYFFIKSKIKDKEKIKFIQMKESIDSDDEEM